jgi:hypothetical protein
LDLTLTNEGATHLDDALAASQDSKNENVRKIDPAVLEAALQVKATTVVASVVAWQRKSLAVAAVQRLSVVPVMLPELEACPLLDASVYTFPDNDDEDDSSAAEPQLTFRSSDTKPTPGECRDFFTAWEQRQERRANIAQWREHHPNPHSLIATSLGKMGGPRMASHATRLVMMNDKYGKEENTSTDDTHLETANADSSDKLDTPDNVDRADTVDTIASPFMTPATSVAATPAKTFTVALGTSTTITTTPLAQVTSVSNPDLRRLSDDQSATMDDLEDPLQPSPDSDDEHTKPSRGSRLKRMFKRSPHGSRDSIHRSPSSEADLSSTTKSASSSPRLSRRLRNHLPGHRRAKSDASSEPQQQQQRAAMQQLLSPTALKNAIHPADNSPDASTLPFQGMNTGEQRPTPDETVVERLETQTEDKSPMETPDIEVTEALSPNGDHPRLPVTQDTPTSKLDPLAADDASWARAAYPDGLFPPLPALVRTRNAVCLRHLDVALTSHHLARLGRFADDYQEPLPSADLTVSVR